MTCKWTIFWYKFFLKDTRLFLPVDFGEKMFCTFPSRVSKSELNSARRKWGWDQNLMSSSADHQNVWWGLEICWRQAPLHPIDQVNTFYDLKKK